MSRSCQNKASSSGRELSDSTMESFCSKRLRAQKILTGGDCNVRRVSATDSLEFQLSENLFYNAFVRNG